MRLTLRTLLAYLDDTLEPTEAKLIGQKVAESDTAQELVARIKEVTRRRRITTPGPAGPGSKVDPNSIAEYLDNALTADQLAEVEQLALASDVHLAEIASCHQMLTLVLGEPALVPPSAYKRMYGLVKPPESDPAKRPPVRRGHEEMPHRESQDVDETLRLGMPALKVGNWTNRLILIGGAAAVLLLLAVAIWQLLPPSGTRETDVGDSGKRPGTAKVLPADAGTEKDKATPKETDGKGKKDTDKDKKQPEIKDKQTEKEPEKEKEKEKEIKDEAPAPPQPGEFEIGFFEPPMAAATALLLQQLPDKKTGKKQWTRVLRGKDPARVVTNAPLLSLPGYKSVVVLDSGLRLTLWGNLPELSPLGQESLVLVHPNEKFDLDLTLQRGRIALVNPKDQPLKVRVRFDNPSNFPKDEKPSNSPKGEVWDITLVEKNTEVVLLHIAFLGEPFYPDRKSPNRLGPMASVSCLATAGKAVLTKDLNASQDLVPPPDGVMRFWHSRFGERDLQMVKGLPFWLNPAPGDAKVRSAFLTALDTLNKDLLGPIDSGLLRALKSTDSYKSRLAVRCLAAVDDVQRLIEVLSTHKEKEVRWEAKETLQTWIAYGPDNEYVLFDALQAVFTKAEAEIIVPLLRNFPEQQQKDPALHQVLVEYLTHPKPAIRELAYYHLWHLVPAGRDIAYNATAPLEQCSQGQALWRKLIAGGKGS